MAIRETIQPAEALKLVAATFNNPSIEHERIDMRRVYETSAEILNGRNAGRLSVTARGAAVEGLTALLSVIHVWKPAEFDVTRGVRGTRRKRIGPKSVPMVPFDRPHTERASVSRSGSA